ncbi:MAG TPA: class II aldolase/adducin family protein [Usitatibacter sp.]|nr:class II aldolase/adducin family protein [Usitatibacter sp.]
MSVRSLPTTQAVDEIQRTKVQLAAALRLAVFHELEEGIDNHFTVTVPGRKGQYLILPFGLHWSEARASDMIAFDDEGKTVEGNARCELSAWCIHAPIHRIKGANVVLHTHQTWATALNMLKDNRLLPATQTAAFLCDLIAYDDEYQGTADYPTEGERLSAAMGDKPIAFLKNHGVLVTGDNIAQAYRRLYKLERCARMQMLALATGKPLNVLPDNVIAAVMAPAEMETHSAAERDRLFFEAMMRVMDRENPGYAS